MFDEMRNAGRSEASVLAEFGSPEKCAKQVLAEEREGSKNTALVKDRKRFSAAEIVGLIFFTLLLTIPVGSGMLGILVSFGALSLSGALIGVAGLIFAVYFPFSGVAEVGVMAGIGIGVAASGVGLLLFVGFFYATKGLAIVLVKALKAVYVRR